MRIVMTTEILSAIKIIKMYCWEIPFTDKATQLRKYKTLTSDNFFTLI